MVRERLSDVALGQSVAGSILRDGAWSQDRRLAPRSLRDPAFAGGAQRGYRTARPILVR